MTDLDRTLLQLVRMPGEERNHEAKRSFPWRVDGSHVDADLFADLRGKVTRTIMALANLPGGGRVVVGVGQEASGRLSADGMPEEHLVGWSTDEVLEHVNKYASPEVRLRVDQVTDETGLRFIIVSVQEFEEVPVVCSNDQSNRKGQSLLRRGATYVRGRKKIESIEISSQTEMRELVGLATQKQLRSMLPYVTQLLQHVKPGPSDAQLFEEQLGESWA